MIPAVSYQGAKQRIAPNICARFNRSGCPTFFDLCCGSGAVAIEMVNQGHYGPRQIVMVDSGPWGLFWTLIGHGEFSLVAFRDIVSRVPRDLAAIKGFMEQLIKEPSSVYSFLLLQAGAFGGKAVRFHKDDTSRWASCSFRNLWLPTATSKTQRSVNPMMPLPDSLFERVALLVAGMAGVTGILGRVEDVVPPGNALVYIDPPYGGTTGYGDKLDVMQYVERLQARCYISEGKALSQDAVCVSKGRAQGGMNGKRSKANEEWLSYFEGGGRGLPA